MQREIQAVTAVVQFAYNASFAEYCAALPTGDRAYRMEKYEHMTRNLAGWWGTLDPDNQRRVMAVAWDRWYSKTPSDVRDMTGLSSIEQLRLM